MVMDDAVAFLAKARARYRDRPQVYRRFLDAMQRYGGGALDVAALRAAVQALFAGHPALLKDFDAFVPRVGGGWWCCVHVCVCVVCVTSRRRQYGVRRRQAGTRRQLSHALPRCSERWGRLGRPRSSWIGDSHCRRRR